MTDDFRREIDTYMSDFMATWMDTIKAVWPEVPEGVINYEELRVKALALRDERDQLRAIVDDLRKNGVI